MAHAAGFVVVIWEMTGPKHETRWLTSRPELQDPGIGKSGVNQFAESLTVRTNVGRFEVRGNRLSMKGQIGVLRDPFPADSSGVAVVRIYS